MHLHRLIVRKPVHEDRLKTIWRFSWRLHELLELFDDFFLIAGIAQIGKVKPISLLTFDGPFENGLEQVEWTAA